MSLDIRADDDLAEVVAKIAASDANAVRDTVSALDVDQLGETVDAVAGARRVDIYGVGDSGLVAARWPRLRGRLTRCRLGTARAVQASRAGPGVNP